MIPILHTISNPKISVPRVGGGDPAPYDNTVNLPCVPRVGGGDPTFRNISAECIKCSPRRRG